MYRAKGFVLRLPVSSYTFNPLPDQFHFVSTRNKAKLLVKQSRSLNIFCQNGSNADFFFSFEFRNAIACSIFAEQLHRL